ncbi:sensor histidine kinase [Oxalobacteraceae bacterium A2-2]
MTQKRLADFIRSNLAPILQAWEDFARTIEPPALTMNDMALRDHARQMLLEFAADLELAQSDHERKAKSQGDGQRGVQDSAAETHAEARLLSGYTVVQLVSEYRALRSSVLSLWAQDANPMQATDLGDMTRFNEAIDQALGESVARYEKLVKQSQNMFLAILGHDLRNPLGTLVSGSSLILHTGDLPPKYLMVATRMLSSARRMNALVTDLIDFTRTHLGPGIPIHAGPCDLVAICRQVLDELQTGHPGRRLSLDAPTRLEAWLDGARMAQTLSNLMGNALQYGDVDVPVVVTVGADDAAITITVNNRGPLIPADRLGRIFDPFVRAHASGAADPIGHTSLGIGLYIAREIVHAHGGRLDATSVQDSGTTFTVLLPRQPPAPELGVLARRT